MNNYQNSACSIKILDSISMYMFCVHICLSMCICKCMCIQIKARGQPPQSIICLIVLDKDILDDRDEKLGLVLQWSSMVYLYGSCLRISTALKCHHEVLIMENI